MWFLFRTVSARWIQQLAGKRSFATEFSITQMGILNGLIHVREGGNSVCSAGRLCKTLVRRTWFEVDILVVA